ncbi:MAG: FKBP-type peptidyl-prolyl cis-trans isomerase [Desulfobacterales bacterium]|nr:MAG: FKBP-type peptidyl-prolyl cis-trans isomerase [Desulfobacterales bacterium]
MSEAKIGDTVKIHYTGKLDDGTVFDSSEGRDPLMFEIGGRRLPPPIENGVIGMAVGETRKITIDPEEGYGHRRDDLIMEVEKANLPQNLEYETGQRLQMRQPDGKSLVVTVASVSDETVKLDANHPLSGETLEFEIELVDIS